MYIIADPAAHQLADSDHHDPAVLAILGRAARCEDDARTERYLLAFDRFQPAESWPAEARQGLQSFLQHQARGVRIAAAISVASIDPDAARTELEDSLAAPRVEHRLMAARQLHAMKAEVPENVVVGLLGDEDADVRRAAVDLATALGPKRQRRVFRQVLERPDEPDEVLSLVLTTFPAVGSEDDVALLLDMVRTGESSFVRINAISALARLEERIGTREGEAWYREALSGGEESESVKRSVVNAVRVSGNPDFLPLLAAELRAVPAGKSSYADALVETISILLGEQLHGQHAR